MTPKTRSFKARVVKDEDSQGCGIALPFDPKEVWGKVRVPVVAEVNGHAYRTTVCSMGGEFWIPFNKQNRGAAGVEAGQTVNVTLSLDERPRVIETPKDLAAALRKAGSVTEEAWAKMAFTHKREHAEAIEQAKKPETRARRIKKAVEMIEQSGRGKPKTKTATKATPAARAKRGT